jgi:flagellar basal-body rod modification protein FlgD
MTAVNNVFGNQPPAPAGSRVNSLEDLDINQFLQLMISELTNQDPLNPMDNTQLVQQLGHIREIAATNQLTGTLTEMQVGQSLTTASSLLGKHVNALTAEGDSVSGVVDRVSVEVDAANNDQRSYRVHVGTQSFNLSNVREVTP